MHRGRRKIDNGWDEFGGYMRAKKTKLESQLFKKAATNLFHGVSIYVNGYTVPPASKLRALITNNGGRYQAYYSRASVTHIIADRLPTSKVKQLTDQKVVRATWITDSITAKKLLPWQQYELYPNRFGGVGQQRLQIVSFPVCLEENTSNNLLPPASGLLTDAPTEKSIDELTTDLPLDFTSGVPRVSTRMRRVQQMKLDACLSPPKPTTASSPFGHVAGASKTTTSVVSLKQLLQSSSGPGPSGVKLIGSTSPDKVQTTTCSTPSDSHPVLSQNPSPSSELDSRTDQLLSTFYARSRLHHLSSWANELHQLVDEFRNNPSHRCDLGETWKQTIINDLSEQVANRFDHPILVHLIARFSTPSLSPEDGSSTTPPPLPPFPRILLHIDMDCFFVSVSLRDRPDLKDKPVAVTHVRQRETDSSGKSNFGRNPINSMSEIASCSYAARKAGCKNGMLLGQAKKLCPELQTVPYDFEAYKKVSETLYSIVSRFTLTIEAVSCDELYADCTELLMLPSSSKNPSYEKLKFQNGYWYLYLQLINPLVLGAYLRELVHSSTGGCTASIGFGTTRLLARLATKRAKPDGQWFLFGVSGGNNRNANMPSIIANKDSQWEWFRTSDLQSSDISLSLPSPHSARCELTGEDGRWFRDLPTSELPGIGHVLVERLSTAFSVITCGEVMDSVTRNQLIRLFGSKTGSRIYELCHARDEGNDLQLVRQSKSVSACMNYGIRLQSYSELESLVRSLCQELVSRMAQTVCAEATSKPRGSRGVLGRCLTVRVFVRAPNAPVESAKYMGHGICTKASRMHSFPEPTSDVTLLQRTTLRILRSLCPNPKELRGLGLQMNKLSASDIPCAGRFSMMSKVLPSVENDQRKISVPPCPGVPLERNTDVFSPLKRPSQTNTNVCFESGAAATQRIRRRSLRLKPRVSFKDCTPRESKHCQLIKEPEHASESVPAESVHETKETNAIEVARTSPITPPRDHQENYELSECHFQLDGTDDAIPVCSTPRHPPNLQTRETVISSRCRSCTSKHTDGACLKPITGTARSRNTSSPTKELPEIMSRELSPITQAMSNPIGLFEGKSLEQLKLIFADWITNEPYPLVEDVCILAAYLNRVVPYDLDRVRSCLIMLERLIDQLVEPQVSCSSPCDWRRAFRRITETVALAVRRCYGDVKLQLRFPISLQ